MNRIKEVLEEKGIKQIWLAEQLGKSYNMVNSYAQNRRQPSLETLFEISKILKVEVKVLIKEDWMDIVKEADIEYGLVGRLQDLKYTYRKDIRD